jgi:hypothetical protein
MAILSPPLGFLLSARGAEGRGGHGFFGSSHAIGPRRPKSAHTWRRLRRGSGRHCSVGCAFFYLLSVWGHLRPAVLGAYGHGPIVHRLADVAVLTKRRGRRQQDYWTGGSHGSTFNMRVAGRPALTTHGLLCALYSSKITIIK